MRKKKSEKSGIANPAERLCDKHGHNNDDAMTRRTGKRTENAKIPRTQRLFFESCNTSCDTSCEQKRKTSSGDAALWNLLLSFLSLFRLPANTASLFSPTVATANTTGQQCGPVRIARVRPLIPRVSFFRPQSVLLLPSHTLPSPPRFCLYAPSFPSLLIPAPSFSRSSRRSPFDTRSRPTVPVAEPGIGFQEGLFATSVPSAWHASVCRVYQIRRELRLEKGSGKNEIRLRSYIAWMKIPRG